MRICIRNGPEGREEQPHAPHEAAFARGHCNTPQKVTYKTACELCINAGSLYGVNTHFMMQKQSTSA